MSHSSKSNDRKSTRGRQKSGRSKDDALLKAAEKKSNTKRVASDGIDFFSLLMGMVTTMAIGLLVYSQLSGSAAANRALDEASNGEATSKVNSIRKNDFEEMVESGSSAQLRTVLAGLELSAKEGSVNNRVEANLRRIDVSNKMLTMKLSPEERKLAIIAKLNALTMNYGFTFQSDLEIPSAVGSLKTCARLYVKESDTEISRTARMGLFNVEAFEMTKEGNTPDLDFLTEQISELFQDFPNDELVLSNIGIVVHQYQHKFDRAVGLKLGKSLYARKAEFNSPKVLNVIHDLVDESNLLESNYYELFENRWVNAPQGQRELLTKSKELANDLDPGQKMIDAIDQVAHWFEEDDQYEKAIEIYEEIASASDKYANPEVAAIAKQKSSDGIKRAKLTDKPIDLLGCQFDGTQLPPEVVKNKIVVVVFWSSFEKNSVSLINALNRKSPDWETKGIRVLAVNVDRKRLPEFDPIIPSAKNIHFIVSDPTKNFKNKILDQCPSTKVPRVMLIKRDGTVSDVNVPITEVNTEIDFLSNN